MNLSSRGEAALAIRDSSLVQEALLQHEHSTLPLDVSRVPDTCGLLTHEELDLTANHDATALLGMLRGRKVSATLLLSAFRKRATIAHQCTNCLTQLIPEALDDAQACDAYLERTGKTIGPLHGLPISLKEQISIAGHYTNAGFVAWVNRVTDEDAHIVKTLKRLGAVIFARTNQPQALMHLETCNNIYGATTHFMDRRLTAGGSTGGEGALMGMAGSPMGIGGDIGGSIRVPAGLNGVYGFLPSLERISGQGALTPSPGMDSIAGTLGPFTRSLRDLELFCRAYSSAQPWIEDVSLIPTDILSPALGRQPLLGRPLRVGFMPDDGVVSPLPPVHFLMKEVGKRLRLASGIECKPFVPLDHARAWRIVSANYFEDNGSDIRRLCAEGDEPLLPLTDWILKQCEESLKGVAATLHGRKAARDAFRQEYARHWEQSGVDVLVMPVCPSTAPPLGTSTYWGYTAVWNLLRYPVITMPASGILGKDTPVDSSRDMYEPKNEIEEHYHQQYKAYPAVRELPVGIQIVARRLHENLLMESAYLIESALRRSFGRQPARPMSSSL